MTTNVNNYLNSIIDLQSGIQRSVNSINEGGGWLFKQVMTYTAASPLELVEDTPTTVPIPLADVGYAENHLLNLLYDYENNKFTPSTVGDLFLVSFRGKAVADNNFAYLNLEVNSPNSDFNPVDAATTAFAKNSGVVEFISQKFLIFTSQILVNNGVNVTATAQGANIDLYDYSFTIVRLFSNKGINTDAFS